MTCQQSVYKYPRIIHKRKRCGLAWDGLMPDYQKSFIIGEVEDLMKDVEKCKNKASAITSRMRAYNPSWNIDRKKEMLRIKFDELLREIAELSRI